MIAAARALVERLELVRHPEGGHYRELFRSPHMVLDARGRSRSALTVIYFLLAGDDVSRWHRLDADETWHFATGTSIAIDRIAPDGEYRRCVLAPGGPWQATIPAGQAFAARTLEPGGFALVTCCVAPGFEFEDFALLDAQSLVATFPQHRALIAAY